MTSLGDFADDAIEKLTNERDAARAEVARLRLCASKINEEICQTLGRALGYPRFADDPVNFPGYEDDDVCVGDHVAETIAMEAARRIETYKKRLGEHEPCVYSEASGPQCGFLEMHVHHVRGHVYGKQTYLSHSYRLRP